jgi:acetyl esterase
MAGPCWAARQRIAASLPVVSRIATQRSAAMHRAVLAVAIACCLAGSAMSPAAAQAPRSYPPQLPDAKIEVYKTVGDVKLALYLFLPKEHRPDDRRPAVVFFFGGGWNSGSPGQFQEQCRYLASRGMVAIAADYRVASRHQVKADRCVADAKSAIRYVRGNASRLGIDPQRIAAAGGSAGGHLAACTGVVPGFDEPSEDASISSVPNALVLFNPAVVLAPVEGMPELLRRSVDSLRERMGTEPVKLSPYHHVRQGLPPCIIFHGKADTAVPYATAELFAEAMKSAGNRCELVGYDDQPHGFFNHDRGDNRHFRDTLRRMDRFLASLGWLQGEPTLPEE